jgi:hypothetical protein
LPQPQGRQARLHIDGGRLSIAKTAPRVGIAGQRTKYVLTSCLDTEMNLLMHHPQAICRRNGVYSNAQGPHVRNPKNPERDIQENDC